MNEYVYCTECKNIYYVLKCIDLNYPNKIIECKDCPCNNCNCWDIEDSRKDRPKYEAKTGLTSEKKTGLKQIMGKYSGKASLSTIRDEKLNKITVKPKVKNGKVLFDRNNPDHRYIMEDEIR